METLGRRIAIIGPPCSGKTTLSRVIGNRLGLPVIELDSIYWQPNWTPLEASEFTKQVATVASQEQWVIDGNYSATRNIVWPRAECFVWLDFALPIVLIRVARRSLRRWLSREELWNGNRENLRTFAFSRDSLFLWALKTHHRRRSIYGRLLRHESRPVVRLRTPREVERFCKASSNAECAVRRRMHNRRVATTHHEYGPYGGRYVPETLVPALDELADALERFWRDEDFLRDLREYHRNVIGRPTPLTFASRVSEALGARVYVKREDLCHTGSHKLNNALGQALLARKMGKKRIIAETGAGQHGVATATVCAMFGLECVVYMGEEDVRRQEINVFRMRLLGATVVPVSSGTRTLKDATNEAMRDWVTNVRTTHYIVGSCVGPHPYPLMVRRFQQVIGEETREQILEREGRLPDAAIACVGGGSNAIGFFSAFLDDASVRLFGVEAGGRGIETGEHAAPLSAGLPGVLHGALSYLMQDEHGQVMPTHSISAGLDYPGVGPEHSFLKDSGRVLYVSATDQEALDAFVWLSRMEGLIPAFESAHAFAALRSLEWAPGSVVVVNLSGRGDKDMAVAHDLLGV